MRGTPCAGAHRLCGRRISDHKRGSQTLCTATHRPRMAPCITVRLESAAVLPCNRRRVLSGTHMSSTQDPNQNHLLSAVLDAEYARLAPHLESIPMLLGDVL